MKFVNVSGNTIYLSDINKHIPFLENELQEISLDLAKHSMSFRVMLRSGKIKIVECGDSVFEKNLIRIQNEYVKEKKENKSNIKFVESNDMEVRIRGHFYEAGGYAKVNRNLARGLSDLGINVQIDSTNKTLNQLTEDEIKLIKKLNRPLSRNAIIIDSMIPTFSEFINGKYRILYTTIESETIPQQFIDVANNYNEIWVTSDFCKMVLQKYDIKKPIFVIPDSVDTELYNDKVFPYEFSPPLNPFVFISVFGWSYRKGYDVLLKSYLKEFTSKDPVSLLIVSRFFCNSERSDIVRDTIKEYVKKYGSNAAHIARYSQTMPEKQMPSLYKAANAFVLLSRGEGFGLPWVESSLCGLPVIGTRCSGQTMFLKDDNSYLIDVDSKRPMERGLMHVHYWDDQVFPQLTSNKVIEDAGKTMRHVYENYSKAKNKNKKLQKLVSEKYNIKEVSTLALNRLESIWSSIK